ncbi:hypothetical protein D3C81_1697840 [compost metagenome]
MRLTVVHQGRHQQFGTVIDAFHLQFHEGVGALAQSLGSAHPLCFHQGLDARAQVTLGDADETPGLHQADAGRLVRSGQQPPQQLRGHLATGEMAHVTALADSPVDRSALGVAEGMLAHGRNSAAAASGLEGK